MGLPTVQQRNVMLHEHTGVGKCAADREVPRTDGSSASITKELVANVIRC